MGHGYVGHQPLVKIFASEGGLTGPPARGFDRSQVSPKEGRTWGTRRFILTGKKDSSRTPVRLLYWDVRALGFCPENDQIG